MGSALFKFTNFTIFPFFEGLPHWEEDGGAGESTIILISPRLAGLYTPLMMDKILHSLGARNTQRLANEATIDGERLIFRSEFYSMSDLSKTPILFTPPEVRYKHFESSCPM